jgi:hypothetical protein
VVHVTSSWRSRGDEVEDIWVNVMGCIGLFYPNFTVFIVLGHKGSLVISFPINRTPRVSVEDQAFSHPSPTPNHSCFLRDMDVLHGVREVRRGSERSLQSFKEWEDIVLVFTPCRLLICINIAMLLD